MRFFFLATALQSRLASLALDGTQFKKENSEFSNYEETLSLSFPRMQSNSQMIKKLEAVESHNLERTWHKNKNNKWFLHILTNVSLTRGTEGYGKVTGRQYLN